MALYENAYSEPDNGVSVRLVLVESQYRLSVRFYGKGSMSGAKAFVRMLDEVLLICPEGARIDSLLDTRDLDTAPVRSQLILAKWMIQNRNVVDRIAMLGAKPMIRRLATAVLKAARFNAVRFARTPEEAASWTGFSPD